MTTSTAFITLENISKRFPGVLALDQINLTLNIAWPGKMAAEKAPSLKLFPAFISRKKAPIFRLRVNFFIL